MVSAFTAVHDGWWCLLYVNLIRHHTTLVSPFKNDFIECHLLHFLYEPNSDNGADEKNPVQSFVYHLYMPRLCNFFLFFPWISASTEKMVMNALDVNKLRELMK
jgi:hypothetical protein